MSTKSTYSLAALALAFVACATPRDDKIVGVDGALAYRERIALGNGAVFAVRVFRRDGETRTLVASQQHATSSQPPLPFQLSWRRGDAGSAPLELEAEIKDGARHWILPTPVSVPPGGDPEILGLQLILGR